jgi:hypothetical protein
MAPHPGSTGRRRPLIRGGDGADGSPARGFDTIGAMQAGRPAPFEVYCERCRVTFPVGTRRCIHCGGPTSGSPVRIPLRFEPLAPEPAGAEPEIDAELARRRLVSPLTLVWIALIVAGYLIRACSGHSP